MLFNSFAFALFFPVVTIGYFAIPHARRWAWLLAASVLFYMSFVPKYVLILVGTVAVDYVAALLIESATGAKRRAYLVASLIANVGVLAFFKYFDFLSRSVDELAISLGAQPFAPMLNLVLPIGLSFHTFQSMSYTIEVYRGTQRAERHLGLFALYVFFYPQLVAGPIERPQNLLHQFREEHTFDQERVVRGLQLMAWGILKKVVIADRLALMVSAVYGDPHAANGPALALATVLFAFQIYCDFSGYSDIALGSAQVMGFTLMKNFATPYVSQTIAEFWRRWHISLSTWFRDYVFIPLGGSRLGKLRTARNLFVVFLLSGLWHGANWTYVIWGAIHGSYLVVATLAKGKSGEKKRAATRLGAIVNVLVTFVLVTFAWIFFRARTVGDASYIVTRIVEDAPLFLHPQPVLAAVRELTASTGIGLIALPVAVLGIVVLLIVESVQRKVGSVRTLLAAQPAARRWSAYALACLTFLVFAQTSHVSAFIYFQF